MRILRYTALVLALGVVTLSAAGQMRNPPPASIYSVGGTHLAPPFASIYSQRSQPANFGFGFAGGRGFVHFGNRAPGHLGHHGRHPSGSFPFLPFYGYPSYPYYDGAYFEEPTDSLPGAGTFYTNAPQEEQLEPSASTFERRPRAEYPQTAADASRYGEPYLDRREPASEPQPAPPSATASEEPVTTVLIFRDGHRREIQNYAIMGDTLFLFTGEHRKIPLSDLDIPATVSENEDRGIDFRVPAGQ